MDTLQLPEAGRRRRRYSDKLKADIIAACLQPGVSTTAIALANKINPNLVRRWIRLHLASLAEQEVAAVVARKEGNNTMQPALVPLAVTTESPTACSMPAQSPDRQQPLRHVSSEPPRPHSSALRPEPIQLELNRGDFLLKVSWPAIQAESCAHWLRGLLP